MHLYIHCDTSKLEDDQLKAFLNSTKQMIEQLTLFLSKNDQLRATVHAELGDGDPQAIKVGLDFHVKKTKQLEVPLNFFNDLAKEHKQDFVLGTINNNEAEDVCYFGFEEGKGDSFMISQYLGL